MCRNIFHKIFNKHFHIGIVMIFTVEKYKTEYALC